MVDLELSIHGQRDGKLIALNASGLHRVRQAQSQISITLSKSHYVAMAFPLRRCRLHAVRAADTLLAPRDAFGIAQTHIPASNFSLVRSMRQTARHPPLESRIGTGDDSVLTKS